MKKLFLSVVVCLLINGFQMNAQKAFEKYAIGVDLISLYGPGVSVTTTLSPNFYLKAGVNYIGYTYKTDFSFSVDDAYLPNSQNAGNIVLDGAVFDPKLNFTNFKAIIDYYPMKNGIFSISAGLFAGNNSISMTGKINNYDKAGGAIFDADKDITLKPNADGTFDGKLTFGTPIKPYFGLGLGRTMATNNRVGFRFEVGIVYQGKFKLESSNAVTSSGNLNSTSEFFVDSSLLDLLNLYPMLNFTLSYRLN